jgi:hypothetical protein
MTDGYPSRRTGLGISTGRGAGPGRNGRRRGDGVVDVVVDSDSESVLTGRGTMTGLCIGRGVSSSLDN